MTPVLEVRGLAFAYPDGHQALFGVDLHVHRGERVALLGPNGAGKTTLVLHLNGILAAGAGTVAVSGLPVDEGQPPRDPPPGRHRLPGPRRPAVHGHASAQDVGFGPANLGLKGDELEARVQRALEQVGMAEYADRPPHHLSFGQRRRVAVATVLAMEPEILVLDEPSSNLDPASRRELADILRSLDVTVLMVTHDLPYALELCPRSVVLSDGYVVADGSTYDVLTDDALMRAHRLELPVRVRPRTGACHAPSVDSLPIVANGEAVEGPSELARDIEETRERLAGTIDELLYRTNPKTIVGRQVAQVKGVLRRRRHRRAAHREHPQGRRRASSARSPALRRSAITR